MNDADCPSSQPATLRLVVGPLKRHRLLRRFLAALAALPGVREVRPGHFEDGTVEVAVTYAGAAPLAAALETLAEFRPWVESGDAGRLVRVRLLSESDEDDA